MCAERVNWKNEALETWEKRCLAVSKAIYQGADLDQLGEVVDDKDWKAISFKKDSIRTMRHVKKPLSFVQDGDITETGVDGDLSALFSFPGNDEWCATLPVEVWAVAGDEGVALIREIAPFELSEVALWSTYAALIQHDGATLEALGLNVVLEEVKAGLENEVGAEMKPDLTYCYQMLADMSANALAKYGLVTAYEALDAATNQPELGSTGPGM